VKQDINKRGFRQAPVHHRLVVPFAETKSRRRNRQMCIPALRPFVTEPRAVALVDARKVMRRHSMLFGGPADPMAAQARRLMVDPARRDIFYRGPPEHDRLLARTPACSTGLPVSTMSQALSRPSRSWTLRPSRGVATAYTDAVNQRLRELLIGLPGLDVLSLLNECFDIRAFGGQTVEERGRRHHCARCKAVENARSGGHTIS